MLEVAALRASYGRVPVLMGIDVLLKPGEFLGISVSTAWERPR